MDLVLLMDIDGTLTPPRSPLLPEMAEALKGLTVPFHVAAGSDMVLVEPQFLRPLWEFGFRSDFDAFVSNGATRFRCSFSRGFFIEKIEEFDFRVHLGEKNYSILIDVLESILRSKDFALPETVHIVGERIIDRGSMLNFSPIGRPQGELTQDAYLNRKRFAEFDKATRYRKRILDLLHQQLAPLISEKGLRLMYGGQTSFDIVIEGNDKTNPVRKLLAQGFKEVVFLGDALFPGGNDSVISDFATKWKGPNSCPLRPIQVEGWLDTIRIMKQEGWLAA